MPHLLQTAEDQTPTNKAVHSGWVKSTPPHHPQGQENQPLVPVGNAVLGYQEDSLED